ncbi:MAG: HNH endonuclease signature motif containing protein [Candidatus Krumholzibacteria bacterium]|nr:HNH endonuclease signature motif containing protein [Candidatus Krumholzibacteria bacterium]
MKTTSARAAVPEKSLPGRSLRSLSDQELLRSLCRLRERERKTLLKILIYLREIDRRRLYLPLGYPSLFEFCLRRLGYCEPQAGKRIAVARCIGEFPGVYELLASGKTTFTAAAMIARIITGENAQELLSQIQGKTVREVEGIVSRYRPGRAIRERVRPVWVRTELRVPLPPTGRAAPGVADLPAGGAGRALAKRSTLHVESEKSPKTAHRTCSQADTRCQNDTGLADSLANAAGESAVRGGSDTQRGNHAQGDNGQGEKGRADCCTVFEQRFRVEFGVDPGFVAKLERVRALLSTKLHRRLELEELFGLLLDGYLRQHDPTERAGRRERREKKGREKRSLENKAREPSPPGAVPEPVDVGKDTGGRDPREGDPRERDVRRDPCERSICGNNPRHIPVKIRDEVWRRDGGRCAFVSASGRRCGSTWDLEVDHIVPLARGGDASPGNLRLLCAGHNRLEAERVYGREHMERFRGS